MYIMLSRYRSIKRYLLCNHFWAFQLTCGKIIFYTYGENHVKNAPPHFILKVFQTRLKLQKNANNLLLDNFFVAFIGTSKQSISVFLIQNLC